MRDYFAAAAPFASTVIIREAGEERAAKAFVEPISVTSPEEEGRATIMGLADDRRYLLIAERAAIECGDEVELCCGDRVYELLRCEMVGGSHWEGIMKLKGGSGHAG